MPRSVWKGPFVDGYLLKKAEDARSSEKRAVIKTTRTGCMPNSWPRRCAR